MMPGKPAVAHLHHVLPRLSLLQAVAGQAAHPSVGGVYGFSLAKNALRNLAILGEMTNWQ
jgi:hypothetical protein